MELGSDDDDDDKDSIGDDDDDDKEQSDDEVRVLNTSFESLGTLNVSDVTYGTNDTNSIISKTSSKKRKGTPVERKGTAVEATDKLKKAKKSLSSTTVSGKKGINFINDNDNIVTDYIVKKAETDDRRAKVEEERLLFDRQCYEDTREVMVAENRMKLAKMNLEMLSLRKKATEENPFLSETELNALFPLLPLGNNQRQS
jgi:hypothetical protein